MMKFLFVVFAILAPTYALSASFNCQKANTQVEHLICDKEELSKLDEELASTYTKYIDYSDDIQIAAESQKKWLKATRDACQNFDCLKETYQIRVRSLNSDIQTFMRNDSKVPLEPVEGDPLLYAYRCDKHNRRLMITDVRFLPQVKQNIRSEVTDIAIDESTMIKYGGTEDHPLMLPSDKFVAKCQLGKVVYMIEANVVIYGSNPYGQNGAVPPSISLTVKRNGKALLSDFVFESLNDENKIHRISLNESTGTFRVLGFIDSLKPTRFEREFQIKSLPEDIFVEIFRNSK